MYDEYTRYFYFRRIAIAKEHLQTYILSESIVISQGSFFKGRVFETSSSHHFLQMY